MTRFKCSKKVILFSFFGWHLLLCSSSVHYSLCLSSLVATYPSASRWYFIHILYLAFTRPPPLSLSPSPSHNPLNFVPASVALSLSPFPSLVVSPILPASPNDFLDNNSHTVELNVLITNVQGKVWNNGFEWNSMHCIINKKMWSTDTLFFIANNPPNAIIIKLNDSIGIFRDLDIVLLSVIIICGVSWQGFWSKKFNLKYT